MVQIFTVNPLIDRWAAEGGRDRIYTPAHHYGLGLFLRSSVELFVDYIKNENNYVHCSAYTERECARVGGGVGLSTHTYRDTHTHTHAQY